MFYSTYKCAKLLYRLYKLFYEESDANIVAIKKAAVECGVVGTKLLQFIMMHDGFLSAEGKKHFGYVFEDCDYHRWEDTCRMYAQDFGRCLVEDFELDEDSAIVIGSGSIGQVYKLWDKEERRYMAVKVRHPFIERDTQRFIQNVNWLIAIFECFIVVPFSFLVKEFLNNIHCQLDYNQEAKNTNQLHGLFAKEDSIIVPRVVRHSSHFIVMDYYDGKKFLELKETEKRAIACGMYLFILTSLICYDYVHCDLHYGNWKITPENKIVIYDCGIIAQTNDYTVNKALVMMFIDGDYSSISELLLQEDTPRNREVKEKVLSFMTKQYENSSDRLADILKMVVRDNVMVDPRTDHLHEHFKDRHG
jgi:predicted unusual protein kinase regulating ubiquinone biosynthesis (AarF/ABC1/UbiB family)